MSSPVRVYETAEAEVPDEILVDILSRLPVKTLTRFKCVSKSWLLLISSRGFAEIHLRRTLAGTMSTRVLTSNLFKSIGSDAILDLDPPFGIADDERVNLLASHDGLIVFTVIKDVVLAEDGDIYLWNPTTGWCRRLLKPASNLSPCFYELGYDSKIDDYKLLRHGCCFEGENDIGLVYEVLPLRANSWRQVLKEPLKGIPFGTGVFLNKAVHCINTTGRIVTFDSANENFQGFPSHLANGSGSIFCTGFSVLRGCLVTCYRYMDGPFEAWIMKEYGDESSWTKLFDISLDNFPFDDFPYVRLVAIAGRDNMAVVGHESKLFLYDVREATYEELPVGYPGVWLEAKAYVETLVSPFTEDGDRSRNGNDACGQDNP